MPPEGLVITGSGLVCRLGDRRDVVAARVRAAESPPFHSWQPAIDAGCGCHLIRRCDADLSDDVLGVDRRASRFMLGRLLAWGMSSDGAGDMVAPCADGALSAMRGALRHARLGPDDIDYVNTHATSTPVGDLSEVRAMRELFGGRRVPYSSTKGFMLGQGWLAPALHADPVDAELEDWPPVLHPTPSTAAVALSNSFGFGGTNVSLVLGAP